VAEAESLVKTLTEEHGFERMPVADNIPERDVKGLRGHLALAQGDFGRVSHDFEVDIRHLKQPPELVRLFRDFETATDVERKKSLGDKLIGKIIKAKKARGFVL